MHTNLIVELHLKESQAEPFDEMFEREFVQRSLKEPGCLYYALWTDKDDPHRKTIVESWRSQADLDVHLGQAWFKEWAPQMEAALREPLVIKFFTANQ